MRHMSPPKTVPANYAPLPTSGDVVYKYIAVVDG